MRDVRKAIPRRVADTVRDAGRLRRLVVTVYPNGMLGLRPERTRREETISAGAVWQIAVMGRVSREKLQRAAERKARRVR